MSAPNIKEIEWAISELENGESSFSSYSKLADLYIVRDRMMGRTATQQAASVMAYSEAAAPNADSLGQYGDSDFLRAISGKPPADAWAVMDELMDTLKIMNPRVYSSVLRKISAIE